MVRCCIVATSDRGCGWEDYPTLTLIPEGKRVSNVRNDAIPRPTTCRKSHLRRFPFKRQLAYLLAHGFAHSLGYANNVITHSMQKTHTVSKNADKRKVSRGIGSSCEVMAYLVGLTNKTHTTIVPTATKPPQRQATQLVKTALGNVNSNTTVNKLLTKCTITHVHTLPLR